MTTDPTTSETFVPTDVPVAPPVVPDVVTTPAVELTEAEKYDAWIQAIHAAADHDETAAPVAI